jgi:exopolysaccharide biosynthesis protein
MARNISRTVLFSGKRRFTYSAVTDMDADAGLEAETDDGPDTDVWPETDGGPDEDTWSEIEARIEEKAQSDINTPAEVDTPVDANNQAQLSTPAEAKAQHDEELFCAIAARLVEITRLEESAPSGTEPDPEMPELPVTKARRPGKARKRLVVSLCILGLLGGLYCTAVFSDIPFFRKWRDIYIETAMATLNHKWLATAFIPAYIIDGVMAEQDQIIQAQQDLESNWSGAPKTSSLPSEGMDGNSAGGPKAAFFKEFSMLDLASFNDYAEAHPDILKNGYDKLLVNEAGLKDGGTTMKTVQGDQVLAIDAQNGILIVKVTGKGYVGKMAIVTDPSQVGVGVASTLGKKGQSVAQIAEEHNAVLAVNASGFADYQGVGNGGKVMGLLIADGKKYSGAISSGSYKTIGFGKDNRLYIGMSTKDMAYRDAVQFLPALIVNGENVIANKTFKEGTTAFGIQPRTAIGQAEDGTVLLLTIDGRQPG